MKAVILYPGYGASTELDEREISYLVGGHPDVYRWNYIVRDRRGSILHEQEVLIYTGGKRAESRGERPNRMIDGRVVYGKIVVVGSNSDLIKPVIDALMYNCMWTRVQWGAA